MKRRRRKNPSELVSFALVATATIAALYIFKRLRAPQTVLELDAQNRVVS